MDYLKAREALFAAGWQPVDKSLSAANQDTVVPEESISLRWLGIELDEIESCQPTGLGLCSGELELNDGR